VLSTPVLAGTLVLLSFTPTRTGRFPIVCAELCGPYHGGMRSTVIVEEQETFADWVAKNSPAPAPPAPTALTS
ncbi:MAG: cytochrome C oxidase subunit II, partial [Vulcanococcus sp.]